MILSGFVWALGEPADEAARQVELCHRNIASLVNNFADAGFTAVADIIFDNRQDLGRFLKWIAPRDCVLVVLAPGEDSCRSRNATRDPDEAWDFDGYAELDLKMRSSFGTLGWWLDSAQLGAAETAELVLQEAEAHARLS